MISLRSVWLPVTTAGLILGGCSTDTGSRLRGDPLIWGRADCQRGEGNPQFRRRSRMQKRPVWRVGKAPGPLRAPLVVVPA
jgi:hypothetical protein